MGLIKSAGDLIYTFRFLTLLVTKFEDTEAYKAGIIDAQGNRIKTLDMNLSVNRTAVQNYYTPFHRLVFNLKKLMAKVPGGSTSIASYAAALYLIKEKYGVAEHHIERGLKEVGFNSTDFVTEQQLWFVLNDGRLSPGSYRLRQPTVLASTLEDIPKKHDWIRANADCYPVGQIFGVNVYEATHVKTNQPIYVTVEDLWI